MAIETFGVTADSLRAHHFPHFAGGAFSVTSKPSLATVTEMVSAAAAELAGYLSAEGVSASSLTEADTPNAYAWCADTVRLGAAARVARTVTNMRPEAAAVWQAAFDARVTMLEDNGYVVLGDAPATSEEPNGPRSHIGAHDLDTGDEADISDVVPRFRRSDSL